MRTLLRLLLLVVVIVVVVLLLQRRDFKRATLEAKGEVGSAVQEAKRAVDDLDTRSIVEDLKRTGQVVRRKTAKAVDKATEAADRVAEVTEDARTTASIKAKLAMDPELSALDISVDTTNGRVTLAGRVDSPEHVARALRVALEPDNVHEVISTLQVREQEPAKKVTLIR